VPEPPFVTVFTMTFNQRTKVLRLADDLARQRYPADRFELVVLDDGGTDGTTDALHLVAPGAALPPQGAAPGARARATT
jgi:Glycosyl transferase family 2